VLPGLNTPKLAREACFCAHTPEAAVVLYAAQLEEESPTALLETMFPNRLKPQRVTMPVLVVGAECDGGVTPNEVRAAARAYRTEAEFFPDMGHDMMPEPKINGDRRWRLLGDLKMPSDLLPREDSNLQPFG
jgi:pimeloyl-ACP methyl ester carboxylesterase